MPSGWLKCPSRTPVISQAIVWAADGPWVSSGVLWLSQFSSGLPGFVGLTKLFSGPPKGPLVYPSASVASTAGPQYPLTKSSVGILNRFWWVHLFSSHLRSTLWHSHPRVPWSPRMSLRCFLVGRNVFRTLKCLSVCPNAALLKSFHYFCPCP